MRTIGCAVVASLLVLAGCGKQSDSREPSEIPTGSATAPGAQAGEPGEPGSVQGGQAQGAPLSEEQLAQRFDEMIAAFNSKDVAALTTHFADDAKTSFVGSNMQLTGDDELVERYFRPQIWSAFPDVRITRQLTLVDDATVVAIVHATGTNSGPVSTAGPTNKKVGIYGVIHAQFRADGKIEKQTLLFDPGVVLAQLGIIQMAARAADEKGWDEGRRKTVISNDTPDEAARLTMVKMADQAFAAGKMDQVLTLFADDVTYVDPSLGRDVKGAEEVRRMMADFSTMFIDFTVLSADYLAAGDWVVSRMDYRMTAAGGPAGAASGKTVQSTDYTFYHFDGDKVSHVYTFHNGLAIAAQMGLVGGGIQDPVTPAPKKKGSRK